MQLSSYSSAELYKGRKGRERIHCKTQFVAYVRYILTHLLYFSYITECLNVIAGCIGAKEDGLQNIVICCKPVTTNECSLNSKFGLSEFRIRIVQYFRH